MPILTRDGVGLSWRQWGNGPRHMVCVHGLRNAAWTWEPLAARVDPDVVTITALDLPGCGDSDDASADRHSLAAWTDDLRAVIAAADATDPVLVGHSLGGGIVLHAVLERAVEAAAAVLIAPIATSGLGFAPPEVRAALRSPTPRQVEGSVRMALRRPVDGDQVDRLVTTAQAASVAHAEGAVDAMEGFVVADRLDELRLPSLVVAGDADRLMPVRFSLRTAAAIRGCAAHVLHGVGHYPHWEEPDDIADVIGGFVVDAVGPCAADS